MGYFDESSCPRKGQNLIKVFPLLKLAFAETLLLLLCMRATLSPFHILEENSLDIHYSSTRDVESMYAGNVLSLSVGAFVPS